MFPGVFKNALLQLIAQTVWIHDLPHLNAATTGTTGRPAHHQLQLLHMSHVAAFSPASQTKTLP
jgi:hypothetical protein